VRRHDLGEVVEVQNPQGVCAALRRLHDPRRRAACAAYGRRAFAPHASANFKQMLTEALAPKVA
jgi:hypothetical protein